MGIIIPILIVVALIGIPFYIIRLILDYVADKTADKIIEKLDKCENNGKN